MLVLDEVVVAYFAEGEWERPEGLVVGEHVEDVIETALGYLVVVQS